MILYNRLRIDMPLGGSVRMDPNVVFFSRGCYGEIFFLIAVCRAAQLCIACGRTLASYQTGTRPAAGTNTPSTLSWRQAGRQTDDRAGTGEGGIEGGK